MRRSARRAETASCPLASASAGPLPTHSGAVRSRLRRRCRRRGPSPVPQPCSARVGRGQCDHRCVRKVRGDGGGPVDIQHRRGAPRSHPVLMVESSSAAPAPAGARRTTRGAGGASRVVRQRGEADAGRHPPDRRVARACGRPSERLSARSGREAVNGSRRTQRPCRLVLHGAPRRARRHLGIRRDARMPASDTGVGGQPARPRRYSPYPLLRRGAARERS